MKGWRRHAGAISRAAARHQDCTSEPVLKNGTFKLTLKMTLNHQNQSVNDTAAHP